MTTREGGVWNSRSDSRNASGMRGQRRSLGHALDQPQRRRCRTILRPSPRTEGKCLDGFLEDRGNRAAILQLEDGVSVEERDARPLLEREGVARKRGDRLVEGQPRRTGRRVAHARYARIRDLTNGSQGAQGDAAAEPGGGVAVQA